MTRFFISNLSYRSLLWPPRQKRSPQPRSQRKAPKKPSGTPPTSCVAVLNPRSTIRTLRHSCERRSRLRDRSPPTRLSQKPLKRREPRRTRRALRRAFLFLSGLRGLRGSRLLSFLRRPPTRVLQKPLKRRKPQRHGDTKFFPGLPRLRPADKKDFLCALVSLWFNAFMPFATLSFTGMTAVWVSAALEQRKVDTLPLNSCGGIRKRRSA